MNNKIILKKKKPNATDSRDMDKKKKKENHNLENREDSLTTPMHLLPRQQLSTAVTFSHPLCTGRRQILDFI
jgi:hypothetical protein